MRKHLMTGLVILATSYSVTTLASSGNITGSGNIGSGALGTDNFMLNLGGGNPAADGDGPGGLSATLTRIFFGGVELHFNTDGILVTPDETPFTGTTSGGDIYKDGKKV